MNHTDLLEADYQATAAADDAFDAEVEQLLDNEFAPLAWENINEALADCCLDRFKHEFMRAVAAADDAELGRILIQAIERHWLARAISAVEARYE